MPTTDPLSFQLYSARKFPPLADTLTMLAGLGYTSVEPFGGLYDDLDALERGLKDNGLAAKSGHVNLTMVEDEPARTLEVARRLGFETVVVPYLSADQRPTDGAGWQAIGGRLAAAGRRLADEGLKLAWHNHDFEFRPLPDGSLPIEALLGETLLWEADLAWVAKADADPLPWLERYKGRTPLIHVKDIAPAGEKQDEDGWADVGTGILDWPALWRAAVAGGAEVMVAEHDNPSDAARFARVSAEAMTRMNQTSSQTSSQEAR